MCRSVNRQVRGRGVKGRQEGRVWPGLRKYEGLVTQVHALVTQVHGLCLQVGVHVWVYVGPAGGV